MLTANALQLQGVGDFEALNYLPAMNPTRAVLKAPSLDVTKPDAKPLWYAVLLSNLFLVENIIKSPIHKKSD
jgi:hypothetical protein